MAYYTSNGMSYRFAAVFPPARRKQFQSFTVGIIAGTVVTVRSVLSQHSAEDDLLHALGRREIVSDLPSDPNYGFKNEGIYVTKSHALAQTFVERTAPAMGRETPQERTDTELTPTHDRNHGHERVTLGGRICQVGSSLAQIFRLVLLQLVRGPLLGA
ncbi:uncharacterized protein LOC101210263 [Anopheles sinensis]|uniref:Uncharacterized protein LOC101210263 n=1 Tax=Anopheles sinensis TaxID=74873 RepID=A0A084WRS3_ANOSI|nr:uncharacterized protein LOC101210263 [Anopheles sinensis]